MKENEIIEAARNLFHKFGYKKVSMDEIAMESGVTKRTVYKYFESKEELLKYFIEEEIKNMKNIVEEVEKADLEFFESINQGLYKLLKYRKENGFLNNIAREAEILKNNVIISNLKLIDEHIKEYIKEKVQSARKKEYIDYEDEDENVLVFLIYKVYISLMFDWGEKANDEETLARIMCKILKRGIKKEEM